MLSLNSSKQPNTEMWLDKVLGGLVDFFTSIRVTVVCLALGLILVFLGTIAQVEMGLYKAQQEFFRSFFVFWTPSGSSLKIPVLPGGYLVGGLLLLNLLASFFNRFSMARRSVGIWLIHAGLVLLLVGQLLTDVLSVESGMQLTEGESKNYSEDFRSVELAVVDTTDGRSDVVYSIPAHLLFSGSGHVIQNDKLPFRTEVKNLWHNASLVRPGPEAQQNHAINTGATAGDLKDIMVIPQEISKNLDSRNTPAAVVEISDGSASSGSLLVSPQALNPQRFALGNKTYEVSLRFARYYYPFSISLLQARHDKYKGTEIPKNFSSRVRVDNAATGETRETLIKMNSPLRYGGHTFYQYQMSADDMARQQGMAASSTLQVVRNPGWLTPYVSTVLVSIGLLMQFGAHLWKFVRRKKA